MVRIVVYCAGPGFASKMELFLISNIDKKVKSLKATVKFKLNTALCHMLLETQMNCTLDIQLRIC